MESATKVQIWDEAFHILYSVYSLGKGMDLTILSLAMGK